jgi:hypothetical protein
MTHIGQYIFKHKIRPTFRVIIENRAYKMFIRRQLLQNHLI